MGTLRKGTDDVFRVFDIVSAIQYAMDFFPVPVILLQIYGVPVCKCRTLYGIEFYASYPEFKIPVTQLIDDGTVSPDIKLPVQYRFGLSSDGKGMDPEIIGIELFRTFDLCDPLKFPGKGKQCFKIGERFFVYVHISAACNAQQPVDIVVLFADHRPCGFIPVKVGNETPESVRIGLQCMLTDFPQSFPHVIGKPLRADISVMGEIMSHDRKVSVV